MENSIKQFHCDDNPSDGLQQIIPILWPNLYSLKLNKASNSFDFLIYISDYGSEYSTAKHFI